MSSALVVGSPGCGMTTFFGLLYTAEVRLGIEEADTVRFHFDRESIRRLEAIYGELGSGRFPESEVDWGQHPLAFLLGVRRTPLRHPARSGEPNSLDFDARRVEVGGLTTEEAAELADRDAHLDEMCRRLLRSPIVVALVDATTLPAPGVPASPRLGRDDHRLARTFELAIAYLSAERGGRVRRRLSPIFVLTKCDRLAPAERAALRLGPTGAFPASEKERAAFGGAVLARCFPKTERALAAAGARGVSVAPATWFVSELGIEPDAPDRIRRRWRVPGGGWEPEYPWEEYRALLGRLGVLAHRLREAPAT